MLDIKDIKANVLSGNSPKIIILEKDTSGDGDDILTRRRGKKKSKLQTPLCDEGSSGISSCNGDAMIEETHKRKK